MPDVLLIEDDSDMRSALAELLADAGYKPVGVPGSEEAIRYLNAHPAPCVVLLDVDARDDASSFLRWLREQEQLRELRVAVMSGWTPPDRRLAGFRDYVADVLKKPFGIDDVTRIVAEHCGACDETDPRS